MLRTFLISVGIVGLCCMQVLAAKPPTIYVIGDSTAASYAANRAPLTGWGQVLARFFSADVRVDNRALSGRSSKSFVDEGHWAKVLAALQPGDYLLIQFGHNDIKQEDAKRYTEPYTTFQAYLRQYAQGARAKGAHPIFITPMHRRQFTGGKIRFSHGDYPAAIMDLAQQMDVPLIDLHQRSQVFFEDLGPEGTKKVFLWLAPGENPNYPDGKEDNTHFSEAGAEEIARLVVAGLRDDEMPLAAYLRDDI